MLNMGQMMKQVQDMQSKMNLMQNKLNETEVVGQSGGELVTVTMNGKYEIKKIKIDPKVVDPSEVEMLEDMVLAACNAAKTQIDSMIATETERAMGGIKLPPGMKMPF